MAVKHITLCHIMRTICMSGGAPAFQRELAEADMVSIVDVLVRLGAGLLGDNTPTRREVALQATRSGHVIGVHVSVNCTRNKVIFIDCRIMKLCLTWKRRS